MKWIISSVLIIFLSFLWIPATLGQFSMEEFLSGSRDDQSLQRVEDKLDFLKENNFNSPWLRETEVRLRSNNFDFGLEDFRLRFSPTNPWQMKANKLYYKAQQGQLDMEYLFVLNKSLRTRYDLLIEHYHTTQFEKLYEGKYQYFSEVLKIIGQFGSTMNLDVKDLINADKLQLEARLEWKNMAYGREEIEALIREISVFSGGIDWDDSELVQVEDIKETIRTVQKELDVSNIYIAQIEKKNTLSAARMQVEKTEAHKNIGYLQAEYDTDRGKSFDRHFGYQIGISIPLTNPDKPDLNRRKINLMDDATELNKQKIMITRRQKLLKLRLDHLIDQYDFVSEKLKILEQNKIMELSDLDKNPDPDKFLRLREYQLELEEKRIKISKDLYDAYISYLDYAGKLVQSPMKNYLSKFLREF